MDTNQFTIIGGIYTVKFWSSHLLKECVSRRKKTSNEKAHKTLIFYEYYTAGSGIRIKKGRKRKKYIHVVSVQSTKTKTALRANLHENLSIQLHMI
jgi:hypothetical protein